MECSVGIGFVTSPGSGAYVESHRESDRLAMGFGPQLQHRPSRSRCGIFSTRAWQFARTVRESACVGIRGVPNPVTPANGLHATRRHRLMSSVCFLASSVDVPHPTGRS